MMEPLSRIYEIPRRLESLLLVLHSSHLGQAGVDKGLLAHKLCRWRARCGGGGGSSSSARVSLDIQAFNQSSGGVAHHRRHVRRDLTRPSEDGRKEAIQCQQQSGETICMLSTRMVSLSFPCLHMNRRRPQAHFQLNFYVSIMYTLQWILHTVSTGITYA